MLGWMVMFALMALLGGTMFAVEFPKPTLASMAACLLFVLLLLVSVVARAFRCRA